MLRGPVLSLLIAAVAVPASAELPPWAASLERHEAWDVAAVLGPLDGGVAVLAGRVEREHGAPVAGLRLVWLDGDTRHDHTPAAELLGGDLSADGRLALVDLDGGLWVGRPGALRPLPLDDRYATQVRWSPDGARLAVTAWSDGARPWDASRAPTLDALGRARDCDLFLVDPDSGRGQRLTADPRPDYNPVWSPAGDVLLFTSLRTGYASYFLIDPDDPAAPRQLTNAGAERGRPAGGAPVPVALSDRAWWDAASDRVVYETRTRDGLAEVWSLDPDGAAERLTTGAALIAPPRDGALLLRDGGGWRTLDAATRAGEVRR